ncbi:MAG: fumarate hydratase [Dehalococcoidia bacterium]|nr:fumarate hydratase [Dehalococcoidia bacterium]
MRTIHVDEISGAVARLVVEANTVLGADMLRSFDRSLASESSPAGRSVLIMLQDNARISREEGAAYCQDTGFAIAFVELGSEVHIAGGTLQQAIDAGVRRGYTQGFLRASIVQDPLYGRKNTGDNTPAVVHIEQVPGDHLSITMMAKGGGCENRSQFKMLKPSDGVPGVMDFIVGCISNAGPDACPPLIAGVGIGGTFEKAALLSKQALLRELGSPNPDPKLDELEKQALERANKLGIGPQGYGGDTTALAVHIRSYPCHIASLPVAVTIECHAHRHKHVEL